MNHSVSEVLHLAADDIERNGFAKGTDAMLIAGPHCIEGAIQAASERRPHPLCADKYDYVYDGCPAGEAVKQYLGDRRAPHAPLFTWNDAPSRTAAEVIEVLRAAAVIEESREAQAIIAAANALDAPVVVGARA